MQCPSCGSPLDSSGVFPGGSVQCACGATARVPMEPMPPSTMTAPALDASTMGSLNPPPPACPRCHAELELRDAEGTVVAACTGGHGLFVTSAALREVEAAGAEVARVLDNAAPPAAVAAATSATSSIDQAAPPATLMCPRCGDAMTRRAFGKGTRVIVDVCTDHGTWFDAGELRTALSVTPEAHRTSLADEQTLDEQAKATLDVALALEQAREVNAMERAVDTTDDLLDTFNVLVLGRDSRRRRRGW